MWNSSSYVTSDSVKEGNLTVNSSDIIDDDFITRIEEITVPVICVFGLVGNTLSAFVFSRRTLRGHSSSLFLVARSCSDNGFLATLLAIWASSVYNLGIGKITGLCHLLTFLTYFFGCISVWLVVFVTAENCIRICKPFLVRKCCNTKNATVCVIALIAFVLGIYNFPLWTMGKQCAPEMKYLDFLQFITYADSVITLFVPSTIMATLMFAIAISTMASLKRMRRLSSSSTTSTKSTLTKVTKMLLAVTITFLVLNLPYHAVRLRLMVIAFVDQHDTVAALPLDLHLQSISQLFYYLSMAANVLIYAAFSSRFRLVLRNAVLRRDTSGYSVAVNRVPVYPMRRADLSLPELQTNKVHSNFLKVEEAFPLRRFRSSDI